MSLFSKKHIEHVGNVLETSFELNSIEEIRDEDLPAHSFADLSGTDKANCRICILDDKITFEDLLPLCIGLFEELEESVANNPVLVWKCKDERDFWFMERNAKGRLFFGHSVYSFKSVDQWADGQV